MKIVVFALILLFARPVMAGDLLSLLEGLSSPDPQPDPQYGPVWTNRDGLSVWSHLAQDSHAGKITGDYRSLSHSEATDLHSDLHNTGRVLNADDYRGASTAQVAVFGDLLGAAQSNCPNGVCPIRMAPAPVRRTVQGVRTVTQRSVQQTRTVIQRGRRAVFSGRILRNWRSRSARGVRVGRWFSFNQAVLGSGTA
jgi:hypothetical protein